MPQDIPPKGWTFETMLALMEERANSIEEKFNSVDRRFEDKDLRDEQRFQGQTKSVEAAFAAANAAVNAALSAAEKAVTKAEIAAEKRFDSVNEFRGQLKDQTATFIPRQEAQVLVDNLTERVRKTEDSLSRYGGVILQTDKGKAQSMWMVTALVAIGTAIISMAGLVYAVLSHIRQ